MERIEQAVFQAAELIKNYPPRWHNHNKEVVFGIACSSVYPFEGQIMFSQWKEEPPPAVVTGRSQFSVRSGFFDYAIPTEPTVVNWHMNFSDPHLFCAYNSSLLAQDELQVAEHPILGSLYESLVSSGKPPRTVDNEGRPMPITISGVQRRCVIHTRPNPEIGCPNGLYGNAFERASEEQVIAATKSLSPPTISNILAMAAPACGYGEYTRDEITYIVNTAFTGFSAACQESDRIAGTHSRTVIHTGFWGCGAFGGNRSLMTILQALAADLADVDIEFWAGRDGEIAKDAHEIYERIRDTTSSVSQVLDELVRMKFQWGESDGN